MPKFAARDIVYGAIVNTGPVGLVGKENEFRVRVYKFLNEPWACDPVNFHVLARYPFHGSLPFGSAGSGVIALRKSESRPGARPPAARRQKAAPARAKRTLYGLLSRWRPLRFPCNGPHPAADRRKRRP